MNANNNLIPNFLFSVNDKQAPKTKTWDVIFTIWLEMEGSVLSPCFKKRDKIQQKVLTSLLLRRDRTVFPHFVKLSPINRVEVGHTLADASSASDLFCSSETHFLSIKDEKNGSKENPHERKEGIIFRSCYRDEL